MQYSSNLSDDELNEYLVRNQNASPSLVKGEGAEIEDADGRRYIDLEAGPGVASVGHCHPKVVAALREQAGRLLQVPGRYHSRITLMLAKRLAELAGGDLMRVFFANSGAEATDGAIKCALKHAGNQDKQGFGIIALQHGFHGRLSLPLSLTGMSKPKKGMGPYASFPGIAHAPAPYCYRCPLGLSYPSCGIRCATAVEEMLGTAVPGEAAILIGEPILGVGGVIIPPDEYWPKVESICRRHGITLIVDEVFTGFGRTGTAFGHHHDGIRPDLVSFAKAVGGGVPLGGFIATEQLGTAFEPGDHFTTFGAKNQLGIAAGHAVLDALREECLADCARERGAQFMAGLKRLAEKFPIIGDVRGRGLMIAIEMVSDHNRTPAPELAKRFEVAAIAEGVLISTTGVNGNVLRITPPLVITSGQIDKALRVFETVLKAVTSA
jgi:4-aminobutyrate aminotransferase-like enzyme